MSCAIAGLSQSVIPGVSSFQGTDQASKVTASPFPVPAPNVSLEGGAAGASENAGTHPGQIQPHPLGDCPATAMAQLLCEALTGGCVRDGCFRHRFSVVIHRQLHFGQAPAALAAPRRILLSAFARTPWLSSTKLFSSSIAGWRRMGSGRVSRITAYAKSFFSLGHVLADSFGWWVWKETFYSNPFSDSPPP